jgi:surface antigen
MILRLIASASLIIVSIEAPAAAQFGGVLGRIGSKPAAETASSDSTTQSGCRLSSAKRRGSSALGGMLGGLASRAIGRNDLAGIVSTNMLGTMLTDAIACKLDEKEQKQAATATTEALRGGVGSTAEWKSETRPGVSGSSTVKAQTMAANGASCMEVRDVVIVDGEETTVSKRMCRAPGATGYTISV